MPVIARFYGLIIKMFFRDTEHNPPHIHAIYGEYSGLFNINSGEMMEGDLPPKAQNLIKEWIDINREELLTMWNRQIFRQLPPLE